MSQEKQPSTTARSFSHRQLLFLKYTLIVLIDLVVLGLFNQYWDFVYIETFTIAMLTAMLLQFLMQVAIRVEHIAADYLFGGKSGTHIKVMRGVSAWAIIFVSKLVILEAINLSFGDSVVFSGPIHGLVAFLTVVIVIIIAEQGVIWIYRSLADPEAKDLSQTEALMKILNEEAYKNPDMNDIEETETPVEKNKKENK
jgi:hypothetical protein